ncbi:MAG: restriction endonuclease subunit S, partial [Bacilli bacterium]|nr:restriction endonuclease subunit S [Bacilli bacterium]
MDKSGNNKSIPRIRFAGFTDTWEQRKLCDFGIATSGTSIESEFNEDGIYKVISIGSYSESSTYTDQGIRADHTDKTKSKLLNKGDLTMVLNDKTASGRIIGRVLLIENDNTFVFNQRTQRIQPNFDKYDVGYLYQLLNAPAMREKIIKQSQGNTQIYVNWSTIKETNYNIPDIVEQSKIGILFNRLDSLITLHQRKHDKLVNVKKALLDKMFPKNDQTIPEIRFRGFTDTWEQHKFYELYTFASEGGTPNTNNNEFYEDGSIPFVKIEDTE